jgi:hypothetical protein
VIDASYPRKAVMYFFSLFLFAKRRKPRAPNPNYASILFSLSFPSHPKDKIRPFIPGGIDDVLSFSIPSEEEKVLVLFFSLFLLKRTNQRALYPRRTRRLYFSLSLSLSLYSFLNGD